MGTHYLSAVEAANYLGISPKTLAKWRLSGSGPIFRRFGRRRLYHREDLEAWASARKARSTSDPGQPAED